MRSQTAPKSGTRQALNRRRFFALRSLHLVRLVLMGCIACGSITSVSVAQDSTDAVAPLGHETIDLLERVKALDLPSSTNRITVYYSDGYEVEALRLRAIIEEAMDFYADSLGIEEDLTLAVLTQDHWDALVTWQPYGIPGVREVHDACPSSGEAPVTQNAALSRLEQIYPGVQAWADEMR